MRQGNISNRLEKLQPVIGNLRTSKGLGEIKMTEQRRGEHLLYTDVRLST